MYITCNDYDQSVPCTSLGSVYVYSMTGGIWSLTQTLNGFIKDSYFGCALSYSSTGTQFAVGAYGTNSLTGMYVMYNACIYILYVFGCAYIQYMMTIIPITMQVVILVILTTIVRYIIRICMNALLKIINIMHIVIWYI